MDKMQALTLVGLIVAMGNGFIMSEPATVVEPPDYIGSQTVFWCIEQVFW
jgi:hypothetical protein